jgi:hypothetical protein
MQTEEVMEIFVDYLIGERKSNDILSGPIVKDKVFLF